MKYDISAESIRRAKDDIEGAASLEDLISIEAGIDPIAMHRFDNLLRKALDLKFQQLTELIPSDNG
jgi:hypothetical protein